MPSPLNALLDLLDVQPDPTQGSRFVGGPSHEAHVRAFGGQLIGQLMGALTRSSPHRPLHSVHAYFLRPARVDAPLTYTVTPRREGRSFTNQTAEAWQDDKLVLTAMASFHDGETGVDHSGAAPDVASPPDCPSFEDRYAGREGEADMARWFRRLAPFEVRYASPSAFDLSEARQSAFWIRLRQSASYPSKLEPALQNATLGYISDLAVLDPILMRHGVRWTDAPVIGASLDHAMWLHRPFEVHRWLLFSHDSPAAATGRGLSFGSVWDESGQLVASVTQEALLRTAHRR